MAKALRNYVNRDIPQTEAASSHQVRNNAGGFSFEVTSKTRLERFLILGTDGGTYYTKEMDLTKQNVDFLRKLIKSDEDVVRETAREVSKAGRAYRNDAAIFVMALLLTEGKNKSATVSAISDVVRIGSHVYTLAEFIDSLGGWGPAKRRAIANWFTSKTPEQLAYQAVKYRQRNGWTLRDLMRLSHPEGVDKNVGNFILGKDPFKLTGPGIIDHFKAMQACGSVSDVVSTLNRYPELPWETIPTQYLNDLRVWKKLLDNGQLKGQALVRQLKRLNKLDAFKDLAFARRVADLLTDEEMIRKTRLHPMQYLNAYVTLVQPSAGYYSPYHSGYNGFSPIIKDALDDGFGLSFGNIEPANKRTMISVDVSGSMSWSSAGSSAFTCAQGAGAMALITARTEPMYVVNGFTTTLTDLNLSARDSIESAFEKVQRNKFGGTDCSKPMEYAIQNKLEFDTFIVITDNETYAGRRHPHVALKDYRQKTGIPARLVVMGMAANDFTIADPLDSGMLDVVGFDTNAPSVVADFSAGRI